MCGLVKGFLWFSLVAHILFEVASIGTSSFARAVRLQHGNGVSRTELLTNKEDRGKELDELEAQAAEYARYWDAFIDLDLGNLSFTNKEALNLQRGTGVLGPEPEHLSPQVNFKLKASSFSEVGGTCNRLIRPFADFDPLQGHGNRSCRYEPSVAELERFKANPIDLAIVIVHDGINEVAEDTALLQRWEEHSAYSWRAYARYHNYAFYAGKLTDAKEACSAEMEGNPKRRASYWLKPCATLHLIRKHKYLLLVDADTFVTKPLLRMEPLFEKTGLLSESSGKAMALASEWGSCNKGIRKLKSGPVNTGVVLLKHTAEEMLKTWFYNPGCGEGHRGGRQPPGFKSQDCFLFNTSLNAWSFDQLGLAVTVLPRFGSNITILPSGCPVNGPWGDFISHLVGGSFNHSFYDPTCREPLIERAKSCIVDSLGGTDLYRRCSICSLLPGGHEDFSIACPRH